MSRIRTVKPEFFKHYGLFQHEETTKLPVRLAFEGLWLEADRSGRFKWRPEELKISILPYDRVDFSLVLDTLAQAGFLERYEVDGKVYGRIPSWADHQRINNREPLSKLPPSPTEVAEEEARTRMHVQALEERKGKEEEGEGKGKDRAAAVEECKHPLPAPPSAEELAKTWCSFLTRRKNRLPADDENDKAEEFRELLRLGFEPGELLRSVEDGGRDRGEHFWQFKERLMQKQSVTALNYETAWQRVQRVKAARFRHA